MKDGKDVVRDEIRDEIEERSGKQRSGAVRGRREWRASNGCHEAREAKGCGCGCGCRCRWGLRTQTKMVMGSGQDGTGRDGTGSIGDL